MQTFKSFLAEADSNIDFAAAKQLTKKIKRKLDAEMTQEPYKNGDSWDLSVRAYQYFTPREGEEDDDWPDFTGGKEVEKKVKSVLPSGIEIQISPEEKDWITISVRSTAPPKAAAKDKGKKIKDLIGAAENEGAAAPSGKYRIFSVNLAKTLAKHLKRDKRMTEDKFMSVAATTPFYDYDAAAELWSSV